MANLINSTDSREEQINDLTVGTWAIATTDGTAVPFFKVSGTLDPQEHTAHGARIQITGAGDVSDIGLRALTVEMVEGYTGNGESVGALIRNTTGGSGDTYGAFVAASGLSTGSKIGVYGEAGGNTGVVNTGVYGIASENDTKNNGVIAYAENGALAIGLNALAVEATQVVAGYFRLTEDETYIATSAVIVADAAETEASIFLGVQNSTDIVFEIKNDGSAVSAGSMDAVSYKVDGTPGASGTFTTADSKTVTVVDGIITSIV